MADDPFDGVLRFPLADRHDDIMPEAIEFPCDAPARPVVNMPANPKKAFGDKKPPLDYLPMAGLLAGAEALFDGRLKYGAYNWREYPVEAQTYIEAATRHLKLFSVGEERTRDTIVSNLGAVIACCMILLDAQAQGTMIDNRRKSKIDADLLHEGEEWVERLKEMQAERERSRGGN